MATITKAWSTGQGSVTLTYTGQGNGTIQVTSDQNNLYEARSMQITVRTTQGGNVSKSVTISQAAKVRTDISNAVVTAANQTYSGSSLTPTPTVILNGSTVPSSGYDVAYSNNTNAGTATITVTGKGDYTGTATGTFTIAKANRTVSFYNPTTSVFAGDTVTNVATVSAGASDGTLTYSSSNTSYATVNSSGVVTGVAAGSVTITASITGGTNYNDASGSYSLTVAQAIPTVQDFNYTGSAQSVVLPAGSYFLECWGAEGGARSGRGGYGGYSVGTLTLTNTTTIYVYVGGKGSGAAAQQISNGGFNGGGDGWCTTTKYLQGGGGGASDIRIGTDSLYARVIVAGGGGGRGMYNSTGYVGGYGGGLTGGTPSDYQSGFNPGEGGTQTRGGTRGSSVGSSGSFGQGGGYDPTLIKQTAGGGGGWYGGGSAIAAPGGGGSGYVYTADTASNYPSGCLLNSSYYLSNAETIDGDHSFPDPAGGTEKGHQSYGYIRITKL